MLAYRNDKIVKSHDLLEIHSLIAEQIEFNDDELAVSYPNPTRILPPRDEIKKVLEFADQLLDRVCTLLNISTHEIKSEPN